MKKKLLISITASAMCLCVGVGTLVGCLLSRTGDNIGVVTTATSSTKPTNTSKTWGDSGTGYDIDWAGSGTEEDPYLITSAEELAGLSFTIYNDIKTTTWTERYYHSGKYFKQTCDIDVSAYWWRSIGVTTGSNYSKGFFSGNYNGNGYTVSGVYIDLPDSYENENQGLFGIISGKSSTSCANIQNLGIMDSYIKSSNYVGGIAGKAIDTIISDCYNTGSISGSSYIGGIVGQGGTVNRCYNNGSISGSSYIGGIVGDNAGEILNCYNIGKITGSDCGGIEGSITTGTIINCFNIGTISGGSNVGGILGNVLSYNENSIQCINCFNVGNLTGETIGQIVASVTYGINLKNCYYISGETWGTADGTPSLVSNVSAKSDLAATAKTKDFYNTGWDSTYPWDFKNIWGINSNYNSGYPTFKYLLPPIWIDFADTDWQGNGLSEATAYVIDTPEKLAGISQLSYGGETFSGKYFKQTADISLSGYEWTPIANGDITKAFAGTYDGNGYKISGLSVESGSLAGLFGTVGDTLKNISIVSSRFKGSSQVGSLCGYLMGGEIFNCYSSAIIIGTSQYAGGLVGNAMSSKTMSGCVFTGYVSGSEYVGGIAGCVTSLKMDGCINYGVIEGEKYAGSIVGYSMMGEISNCNGYGQILLSDKSNISMIAGIVGNLWAAKVSNCSFIGESNANINPITNYNPSIDTTTQINSCYGLVKNGRKVYSDGDFSEWAVIPSMNDGMPIQKALYAVAQFGDSVDATWFAGKGFTKV